MTPTRRNSTTGGGRRRHIPGNEGGYGDKNASASWTRIGMRSRTRHWHDTAITQQQGRWRQDCFPEHIIDYPGNEHVKGPSRMPKKKPKR
jgi:hypothetical protein